MQLFEQKVNNARVRKIRLEHDTREVRGSTLFEEAYSNIYLVSRKKSGKTFVIGTILDDCIDRDTHVYLFVSTHQKDPVWIRIKERLASRGIKYTAFMSIKEGKENYLEPIINGLIDKYGDDDGPVTDDPAEAAVASASSFVPSLISVSGPSAEPKWSAILVDAAPRLDEAPVKRAPAPKKKIAPEVVFVFDDMAIQLRDKYVGQLLRTNRHYKSKVIISSQYLKDMKPEARRQIDYWIMFSGIPEAKLETIREDADVAVDEETFRDMYYYATTEKYNFFYIDAINGKFRKNFDTVLTIKPV